MADGVARPRPFFSLPHGVDEWGLTPLDYDVLFFADAFNWPPSATLSFPRSKRIRLVEYWEDVLEKRREEMKKT